MNSDYRYRLFQLSPLWRPRINRRNYFVACIISIILTALATMGILNLSFSDGSILKPINLLINLIYILYILFSLMMLTFIFLLNVRRLHDLNHSGWFSLLQLIPIIRDIFSIYLFVWPGTKNANKYGSKPPSRVNIKQDILQL